MNKREYVSLLRKVAVGSTPTQEASERYHRRVLEKYLDAAYESIISELFKAYHLQLTHYATPETITISTAGDQKYLDVGSLEALTLPFNAQFVRVGPTNMLSSWDQVDIRSLRAYNDSEVGSVNEACLWYVAGNLIQLINVPTGVTSAVVYYVKRFSAYSDTEHLPSPEGKPMNLVAMAAQLMGVPPKPDDNRIDTVEETQTAK